MSKIALSGNVSGTGVLTIAAPNTNSDRTLTLPDSSGTLQVSGAAISGTTGTFTGLVDISAASAGQIKFPASQNASSDANTLDDYEEGTWTPTITNATSYTTANTIGTYVKIGKLVYLFGNIQCAFNNTGSVSQQIGGFPFTIENAGELYPLGTMFQVVGWNQASTTLAMQGSYGLTKATLYYITAGTGNNYNNVLSSSFGSNVIVEFCIAYRVA